MVTTDPAIRLKRICETPGVLSCQATLILPFLSAAICAAADRPELLERFNGVGKNVAPESVERVKRMSRLPGVVSSQATLILAPASTVSHALVEGPELCDRFCALENVAPASPERTKKMSAGLLSSQTTLMLPAASTKSCGFPDEPGVPDRFLGDEKDAPLSAERLRKMSKLPPQSFDQTTLILAAMSKPIRGVLELAMQLPSGFERFMGGEKFRPLSVERLKEMSEWPAMSSSQTTLMLPFLSTAICAFNEPPGLVDTILGDENVAPPSLELLNQMARLPVSLSQRTLMLPVVSTAICGTEYKAVFIVAERFVGAEKVMPPSVERLKKILEVRKLQSKLSSHTILMWAAASTAMTGLKEHPRLLETCFAAGV